MPKQLPPPRWANPWDSLKWRLIPRLLPPLLMPSDRKAMAFVANVLNEVEPRMIRGSTSSLPSTSTSFSSPAFLLGPFATPINRTPSIPWDSSTSIACRSCPLPPSIKSMSGSGASLFLVSRNDDRAPASSRHSHRPPAHLRY